MTNRRNEPDLHNVKIKIASNHKVRELIERGKLVLVDPSKENIDAIKGVNGTQIFRLSNDCSLEVISDVDVKVDGQSIGADVFALPSPAYSALVKASPFTQYVGIEEIFSAIHQEDSPQIITQKIQEMVREGRQSDIRPRLITKSQQFSSRWLPEKTLIQIKAIPPERQGLGKPSELIFLTLFFETLFHNVWQPPARVAMGIDVGLNPHMVIARQDQKLIHFNLTPMVRLPKMYRSEESVLIDIFHYASGRRDSERAIAYLIGNASVIYAEQINHGGMSDKYIHKSRKKALQDALFSYISQFANAARIEFIRVDPQRTSQICPQCKNSDPNNRHRHKFKCSKCGYIGNAHEVAATNILCRGMDPTARYHRTGHATKKKNPRYR